MSWVALGVGAAGVLSSLIAADAQGRSGSLGATTGGQGGQQGYTPSVQTISEMLGSISGTGQPKAKIGKDKPEETEFGGLLKSISRTTGAASDLVNRFQALQKGTGGAAESPIPAASAIAGQFAGGQPAIDTSALTQQQPATQQGGSFLGSLGGAGGISSAVTSIAPLLMQLGQQDPLMPFQRPAQAAPFTPSVQPQQSALQSPRANLGGGGGIDIQTLLALLAQRGG